MLCECSPNSPKNLSRPIRGGGVKWLRYGAPNSSANVVLRLLKLGRIVGQALFVLPLRFENVSPQADELAKRQRVGRMVALLTANRD